MGQYYQAVILMDNKKTVKQFVYSHSIVETYKRSDGSTWQSGSGLKLMEHSWMKNKFVRVFESLIANNPQRVVWAGDYADPCKGRKTNVYDRCKNGLQIIPTEVLTLPKSRYIINHSKNEFIDKYKVPKDKEGWRIHPLPLMTCEGNGRGGGDFRGDSELIGTWARDVISIQSKKPNKTFKEIYFGVTE